MSINEIMEKYTKGELTVEDANAALKEAGAKFHLDPDKTGNAWIDDGLGGQVCNVENGKVVGGGVADQYTILYDGKEWHTNGDGETLVEGPGIPLVKEKEDLPDEVDMSRNIAMAGKTDRVHTTRGWYTRTYDEYGHCVKVIKEK